MKQKFLLVNYERDLLCKLQDLKQGKKLVVELDRYSRQSISTCIKGRRDSQPSSSKFVWYEVNGHSNTELYYRCWERGHLLFQYPKRPSKLSLHLIEEQEVGDCNELESRERLTKETKEEKVEQVNLYDDSNAEVLMSQRVMLNEPILIVENRWWWNNIFHSMGRVNGRVLYDNDLRWELWWKWWS